MVSNKEGWETCAMTDVATKIRKLRKARELTQEQLADRVGTSSEYISLIETGKRKGGTELIAKIANALGISLNDLLDVNNFEAQQPRYKMPVKARVVAGIADEAVEIMSEPIGWEWSSEEPTDDRDVIEIYGDSMEPEFLEGDRLVVEHGLEPRTGDIVVAEFHPNDDEQRLTTVKVYVRRGDLEVLVPLNRSKYQIKVMDSRWAVTGVVVKHIRRQMRGRYAMPDFQLLKF